MQRKDCTASENTKTQWMSIKTKTSEHTAQRATGTKIKIKSQEILSK